MKSSWWFPINEPGTIFAAAFAGKLPVLNPPRDIWLVPKNTCGNVHALPFAAALPVVSLHINTFTVLQSYHGSVHAPDAAVALPIDRSACHHLAGPWNQKRQRTCTSLCCSVPCVSLQNFVNLPSSQHCVLQLLLHVHASSSAVAVWWVHTAACFCQAASIASAANASFHI